MRTIEQFLARSVANYLELGGTGGVLDISVASRLVELVVGKTGAGRRRVGLYGVALVEQPFAVQLFEHPPQSFYVFVIVGDIRIVHIHPIAHKLGEIAPLRRVGHDLATTGLVILLYAYLAADILFGDA